MAHHVTYEKMQMCEWLFMKEVHLTNILVFNLSSLPLSLASYLRKMMPWLT